jgi:hypothetical protein
MNHAGRLWIYDINHIRGHYQLVLNSGCKPADMFGDPRKQLAFFRVSSNITYDETLGDFPVQLFQQSLNIAHGNPRFR